jgi:hypothetical protein
MEHIEELKRIRSILSAATGLEDDDQEYIEDARKAVDALIEQALAAPVQPEHISPKQLLALAQEANLGLDKVIEVFRMAAPAQPVPEGKQFQAKFNIEDRVWYMKNNKPTEVVISAIEVFFVNTNQDQITYNAKNVNHSVSWLDHTKLQEAWLFKSKTELLESL